MTEYKRMKDFTVEEIARLGMVEGPEFLVLAEAAHRVGANLGYTEEEVGRMTLDELFPSERES